MIELNGEDKVIYDKKDNNLFGKVREIYMLDEKSVI